MSIFEALTLTNAGNGLTAGAKIHGITTAGTGGHG
jgi:hypothetical protein